VTNEGTITAANGGYVVLLGNRVSNLGTIVAQLGTVGFGAGSSVTLTFSGDTLVGMQVDRSTLNNLAANGGLVQADGGRVIMTAGAQKALLASVVNNTGVIEARTVEDHDGTITLLGGMTAGQVNVGGTLDASAPNGGNGGAIETSAAHVSVADNARVTTAAPKGLTGSWMVDPQDFTVAASGGDITGSSLSGELATTNVQLESSSGASSGSGNVNVSDPVTWSANTTLTLTASNNVNVNANITATGATAGLVIAPNTANGSETASGTGVYTLNNGSSITLSGANPSLSIAGHPYTVINSLGAQGSVTATDLQGMNGNLSGYYALGSDIDATATASWNGGAGFTPIGSSSNTFTGTFDGLGHRISNLTINDQADRSVGLFAYVGTTGVVQNVGLVGGSVTSGNYTGALVGSNYGMVNNSYATSPVTGGFHTGGLVGQNYGTVKNSHATGAVSSSGYGTGGLVGVSGTYSNYSATHISNSYATGAVTSTRAAVGGLAGVDYGTIDNTYATGSVASTGSNPSEVGGLVGALVGPVNTSYATGHVSAGTFQVGGLVGMVYSVYSSVGTVTNSYWNVTTTGQSSSTGGGTGLTTAQMQTAVNFSGFNFTTTPGASGNNWVMVDADGSLNNASGATGATYPMLASEYATTITNAHQLQLMSMALAASYSLGADIDASATAGTSDVWSTTGGFIPVGPAASAAFSGTFNGVGHTISGLYIVTNPQNGSGMFGASTGTIENVGLVNESMTGGSYRSGGLVGENGGLIQNSYVTGSVTAGYYTGGLAGTNSGTISNSYSTAGVAGVANAGGLVGANYGSITGSYATGAVNAGGFRTGGLVGANFYNTTISNSYATGAVNGGSSVGGLVGGSYGPITDSYATGLVTGSSSVGGLIGNNHVANTITNSFWNVTTTGLSTSSGGGTGLTTAQMQQQGNFSGWDFASTWIGYSGYTNPLLRSFMTPLTVTAGDATQTYSGAAYSGGNGVSYSVTPGANLLGSVTYGGSAQGAVDAGNYALTPQGLYSNQQGYIISYASGALTINPAPLTVSGTSVGNKVYDGTTAATLSGGTLSGVIGSDSVALTQAGAFASANAGTGVGVTASDALSGAGAGNYTLTQPTGLSANITPAALTVNGTSAASKVYDGTTAATLSGGTLSGVIGSDSVALTQAGVFTSPNAGTGVAVTAADALTGAGAGNYTLAQPTGLSADITPAPLTIVGTNVANKVYDGTTTATLTGGRLSGLIGTDPVAFTQAGTFASSNAGNGIAVSASDTLSGTAATNYTLTQPTGLSANITPAPLTVSGTNVANKVYDGTATATLAGGTLSGVIGSDLVGLTQTGTFASANAGTGIAVNATDTLSGGGAGNYTLTQPAGLTANITPATLIYGALPDSTSSGKLVSGLSGTVSGFVTGDTLANSTSGAPVWTTNATALSPPGSYAIDGSGLTSGNYVFAQAASNATALTVIPAPPPPPPTVPSTVPPTPPSVAWLESSVLVMPGNSAPLTFSGPQTLSVSTTVDTPQSTAAPVASSSSSTPAPVSGSGSTSAPENSTADSGGSSAPNSGNGTSGNSSSGYNNQVFEATADFGGGKLRIENGGVRLPDSPPGAH
jgi:hypothetical protein